MGNDHVYDLVSKKECNQIILIDANPYVLEICKNKYKDVPNVTFLNYAIIPKYLNNKFIKFYIPKNDKTSAHCSVSLEFIQKHNHFEWIEQDVPCITLNNLLNQMNINTINKLYIDAEGLDAEIILSLDLMQYNIEYIYFESTHSDGPFTKNINLKNVILKLKEFNYELINDDQFNLGFIKK
jgi:FkbM family methyltransferase